MLDGLKPYPHYKETDAPWLGAIPAHWNVPRLGAVLRERGENNDDGAVADVLSVMKDRGVIPYADKGNVGNKKSDDITRYKVVRPDDIVVNCMNVIIGSVGISRYTGCLSPVYYVLTRRSLENNPAYLNAYFQTKPFQRSLVRIGYGILAHRMRVPMTLLKREPFPLPPPDEQAAIVRFLGAVDRRVNRFIRVKRRLIEVLTEQNRAIITRAVTRGIDSAAALSPACIDGSPAHWDSMAFGRCIRSVDQGWSPVAAEGEITEAQWAVLTLSCMRKGVFRPQAIKPISLEAEVPVDMTVSDGDLLMSRSNTRSLVGDCCIVKGARPRTILCDLIYRVRLNTSILHPRFALYWLLSPVARQQIEGDARGSSSTMVKISHGHIRRWRITVPDLATQSVIVQYIDDEMRPIEEAIERVLREIDLIREYRTRLVADVVTGKVEVRAAASLADADPAEEPSLDEGVAEPADEDDADALAALEAAGEE